MQPLLQLFARNPSPTLALRIFSPRRPFTMTSATPSDLQADAGPKSDSTLPKKQLALPEASHGSTELDMSSGSTSVKLDHLGPIVVNADGTLGRITNWNNLADIEKENTLRIIGKRNQARLEKLRRDEATGREA